MDNYWTDHHDYATEMPSWCPGCSINGLVPTNAITSVDLYKLFGPPFQGDQAAMNIVFVDGIAPLLISMPFSHY